MVYDKINLLTVKSRTRISLMSFFEITFSSCRGPSPPKGLDDICKIFLNFDNNLSHIHVKYGELYDNC